MKTLTNNQIKQIKNKAKLKSNCHQLHPNCRCLSNAILIAYENGYLLDLL